MKGPEVWLNDLGIGVSCVVDPAQAGVLDEAHRIFVNYEAYYLSSEKTVASFKATPWRYTGQVTDPVSHNRFQPSAKSPSVSHDGRLFYFENKGSAKTFDADPAAHATPVVPYAGNM